MKFAHLADCHIGGWKEDKIKELSIQSFEKAIDICIEEQVEFVLISGDLFDNAMPSIDILKRTTSAIRKLKENNIMLYLIYGSHDYSVSGKTILDVLEKAGLFENVCRIVENKLSFAKYKDVKITGLIGKRNSLEIEDFKNINKEELENESGFKIFMFHTGIEEFKPVDLKEIKCTPIDLFPRNFNYYAGGHIHYIFNTKFSTGTLAYPGPLYPNNVKELEQLKHGGFYIVDTDNNITYKQVNLKEIKSFAFRVDNKTPEEVEKLIFENLNGISDKIVILRIEGRIKGQPSQISFTRIYEQLEQAYAFLKITSKLEGDQFQQLTINVEDGKDVESSIINSYTELDKELIEKLISILNKEKDEGERISDFEGSIIKEASKLLELE